MRGLDVVRPGRGERVRALGPASLDDLISSGRDLKSFAHEAKAQGYIDVADFLPTLSRPPKIVCVGLNYADHTKEGWRHAPCSSAFY
jgi:2-keto-4-pentenoate hydratase/2-oxohepta-3-ene-1,7-dioic acid hydratase in catechol pathway